MAIFDHELVIIVFVLGGPGAGKGTQCSLLVDEFDFVHISAGELLRKEQENPNSEHNGKMIGGCIRNGAIVETTVMIRLLVNAMKAKFESKKELSPAWKDGKGRFFIDGFPRNMDQALEFEKTVCEASLVLYLDCDEDTLVERALARGKTGSREDDNMKSIEKRLVVYNEETKAVIEYYSKQNKVAKIDGNPTVNEVSKRAREKVSLLLENYH